MAHHCLGVCLLYQGKFSELDQLALEGLTLADQLDGLFGTAFLMNWRSISHLIPGDFAGAKELLDGMEPYRQMNEHYFLSWHLMQQSRLASAEGRLQDAVDLSRQSVERASVIGYLRVMHVSLGQLGEANTALGDLEAAEVAFTRSLAIAEQMSMVREMLLTMTKVARAQAATGRSSDAAALLATVLSDATSDQTGLFEAGSIREVAAEALADCKKAMDPDEYADSVAAGSSRSYDIAVKELIAGLSRNDG